MITKENIDELISKFLSGEASPDEAMLLDDWKEESLENIDYFNSCKKIIDASAEITAQKTDDQRAWEKVAARLEEKNIVKQLYPKTGYWSMAAAVLLLFGMATLLMYYFNGAPVDTISYKTLTETKKITLADQSKVTISENSELNYPEDFGKANRTLHLKGAAYFDVKHQEDFPFIVDVGNVYIKDIGTKFDIRTSRDTDTVYVRVDEGIVLLFDSAGSELTIKASEKAIYVKSTKKITRIEEPAQEIATKLSFNNSKMEQVVAELEKEYNVRIQIENKALYKCSITTRFTNEPIETVLSVITETLGVTYVKTASGYLIKGSACNN